MVKLLIQMFYIILSIVTGGNPSAVPAPVPAVTEPAAQVVSDDFVSTLSCADTYEQLIVVSADGSNAVVTMHERNKDNVWEEILRTTGYVGKNGVGEAAENKAVTPSGDYRIGIAFGLSPNPGAAMDYLQADDTYYWVDDPDSAYYNQFVTTKEVSPKNWDSAEHITDYPDVYAYVLSINYNTDCIPGAGSAIFLHCSNDKPTLGCVSVPMEDMIFILNHIKEGCRIIIDTPENISNY